ncbi:MAG: signal peptidase I [Deltaproteobacteria bacterium]|nr:signal peptidase I [Deltaproteobacteria bacterium]
MFKRAYQLRSEVIEELKELGLAEGALKQLKTLAAEHTLDRAEMTSRLKGVDALDEEEQKLVLKYSRLSLLRLESFIRDRGLREWIEALLFAVLIALFVRGYIIAPFKIPSGSMIPTIHVGDYIFASKFDYGIQIPFTSTRLFASPIQRGDIIIFPNPEDRSIDYIKRVVGLGNEELLIRNNQVFINGQPLDEPYAYFDPDTVRAMDSQGFKPPPFGPVKVPPGSLFVMGDNRFNSADSRVWGFLEASTVKGKGRFIWWSHNPNAGLLSGYDLGRVGTVLK